MKGHLSERQLSVKCYIRQVQVSMFLDMSHSLETKYCFSISSGFLKNCLNLFFSHSRPNYI